MRFREKSLSLGRQIWQNFLDLELRKGCPKLNPNSVLFTDQAPSPGFCALNPGSVLNPRTLNPGTIVLTGIIPPVIVYCISYE